MRESLDIRTIEHLANRLGCSVEELQDVARSLGRHYRCFEIERKGKQRPIRQARGALETLQGRINDLLQSLPWPQEFQGGIRRRSARTNATRHCGATHVLQADIKDFFPSIRPEMVYRAFVGSGCSPDVARMLTMLTTFEHCVPQGAKSSTVVANLVLWHRSFERFRGAAEARRAALTLYVDDLTVSGQRSVGGMQKVAEGILQQSGLTAKREKTEVGPVTERTVVTGYRPTPDGLRMPQGYVRQVETQIEEFARTASTMDPQKRKNTQRSILGRIRYVATAEPEEARRLFELLPKSWSLATADPRQNAPPG